MTASAAGESSAPPRPCRPRAAISISCELASALTNDATEKTTTPAMNSVRRPSRSAARPPSSRKPPNSSV